MRIKVAYQGTRASFSDMAIEQFFQGAALAVEKTTFEDVFESLKRGEVDLAALPVENSLIGPIVENYDLIARHDVAIIGELCLPVEHCLVGKPGQKIDQIQKVYSHPKALAQCTSFFRAHPHAQPVVHYDTAGAAREVAQGLDIKVAAIGSRKTAEVYGLEILKTHLEDDPSNTTRFLLLKRGDPDVLKEGKCSLLFTLQHAPGSLARVLTVLAEHGLNLTQIVSRPIQAKPFEYLFFVDCMLSKDMEFAKWWDALKQQTQTLKLLGLYRAQEGFVNLDLSETQPNRSEAIRTSKPIAYSQGERERSIWQGRSQSKFTKRDRARYIWIFQITSALSVWA